MNHTAEDRHFTLTTDGSGYTDEIGGWAWLLRRGDKVLSTGVGSATCVSTYQMEYLALLQGVTHIVENTEKYARVFMDAGKMPDVHWYSDCEALVTRIQSSHPTRGSIGVYGAALAEAMKKIILRPSWIPREADSEDLKWCDLQASSCRVMMLSYTNIK